MSAEYSIEEQPKVRLDHNVVSSRLIAAIIDFVLLTIVFLVLAGAMGAFHTTAAGRHEFKLPTRDLLLFALVSYGYYIVMEGLIGATVGKLLMGLQVVDTEGRPCGMGKSLVRNVLRIVDNIPFGIVGLVCILVTGKHQRIGDMAAGTLVVRT